MHDVVPAQGGEAIDPNFLKPNTLLQLQNVVGNQTVVQLVNQQQVQHTQGNADPKLDTPTAQRFSFQQTAGRLHPPPAAALVQREVDEETMDWAESTNAAIEQIQDAVGDARDRLNEDANTAIEHIEEAQGVYDDFEETYDEAVTDFINGVEAAQAKQEEFRKNVKFVAMTALAVAAPTAGQVAGAIDTTITRVQRVGSILAAAEAAQGGNAGSGDANTPGQAAQEIDRPDWSNLLSTTLDSYRSTLQNNDTLNNIASECIDIVRFLNDVQLGNYEGDNPRRDPTAEKAERLANSQERVLSDLQAIDAGVVSEPARELKEQIVAELGDVSKEELEQDIGIRWIASLDNNQLDEIDTAEAYLAEIGVFDEGDNRLDYDTGLITTSDDERIIHWRAEWEALAMDLVGSTVTWLGSRLPPRPVFDTGTRCVEPRVYGGTVRDSRNREWNVSVPDGAPPEGGGQMLLQSYSVDHRDSSGWEWSRSADLRQQLRWEIQFTATPVEGAALGGGAPAPGPVIHAPD